MDEDFRSSPGASSEKLLEDIRKEIRGLRRDLYGDPQTRQKSVFDRLEGLEEKLRRFEGTYEREKIEREHFERLEMRIDQLALDYRTVLVYVKGAAWAGGGVFITVFSAAVVGIIYFLAGGGA